MDPFSITVGILGIVTAAKGCLKLVNKRIGPSNHSTEEILALRESLYNFKAAAENFEFHLDSYDDEDSFLVTYNGLQPVIKKSMEAVHVVQAHIRNTTIIGKILKGAKLDKKLKDALKALDEATKVLHIAVLSDQQTILLSIQKFVKNMESSVHDMHTDIRDLQSNLEVVQSTQMDNMRETMYRDVRSWLAAEEDNNMNRQRHELNGLTRHPGSGEWLLGHSAFNNWMRADAQDRQQGLWVKGSPGVGKSFLCSMGIDYVMKLNEFCLYYFHRFDDQDGTDAADRESGHLAVRVTAILVDQLCRHLYNKDRTIITDVAHYLETEERTMSTLAEIVRRFIQQWTDKQAGGVKSIIHLFLDGLDETRDDDTTKNILHIFQSLQQHFPVLVRVWVSSRDKPGLKQLLGHFLQIDIDQYTKADVQAYLETKVPKFESEPEDNQRIEGQKLDDWILNKLQLKSAGNFLYAKFMVDELQHDVLNVDDIVNMIKSKVPTDLAERYRRIFDRYQESQKKYVSLLFSIIAFARRPLRLQEVQEAMTLALTEKSNRGLDPLRAPRQLQRLFGSLIVVESQDPSNPETALCRLCHSTLLEFLSENPNVLQMTGSTKVGAAPFTICAASISDLCLRYLTQQRYSIPIQLSDADTRGLLAYCARYWDRHLDDIEPTESLKAEVISFISSPNFQILLHVQSQIVAGHFASYAKSNRPANTLYRRAFPRWLGLDLSSPFWEEGKKFRREYRHFLDEWGYLLCHNTCVDGAGNPMECRKQFVLDDIKECLVGILGPANFMNRMEEKYSSFMLVKDRFDPRASQSVMDIVAEGLSLSQEQFIVVWSRYVQSNTDWDTEGSGDEVQSQKTEVEAEGHFVVENWDLDTGEVRECQTSTIRLSSVANTEVKHCIQNDLYFSSNADAIALAGQTYDTKVMTEQPILPTETRNTRFEIISTGHARKEGILIVATRSVYRGRRKKNPVKRGRFAINEVFNDALSDEEDSSDAETSEEDDMSAEESYSEASTDMEQDDSSSSEDEPEREVVYDFSEPDYAFEEDSDAELAKGPPTISSFVRNGKKPLNISRPAPRAHMRFGMKRAETITVNLDNPDLRAGSGNGNRPEYPGLPGRFQDPRDQIKASIDIYDTSSDRPVRLFHFDHTVPTLLYDSPPLLHPFKSLAVWPMSGGDILFANYADNTYFIRRLTSTTRKSRQISIKPRFSPDGRHLHIASLEAQVSPRCWSRSSKTKTLILSAFIATYRLSLRKTARADPILIHKTKVTIPGEFSGLSLAKLPITFTWSPSYVYFSLTGYKLHVYRVSLFKSKQEPQVTIPAQSIKLPLSATARQIYYLPPIPTRNKGMILMSSYGTSNTRVQLKPTEPIGSKEEVKRAGREVGEKGRVF
ncbi:hypothetical protein QBC38DRAFT_539242 [Podospora fimiseda]|uniref:Nephrocystin 3-like N-terminal domain-containing protein n=1 Tax=Podospora fimiseda TaxID=252190 RepID=A0AAN7BGU9_9PEZI|nr:hypothetical protein QBC38DRAFT_539242 [Podospora fimiseda]